MVPENFTLQFLDLSTDPDGNLSVAWPALPSVELRQTSNGNLQFVMHDLRPSTDYTIRLVGPPLAQGRRIIFHQCGLLTPAAPSWLGWRGILALAGLAGAALMVRLWQIRR
jgi:hypothetical protein